MNLNGILIGSQDLKRLLQEPYRPDEDPEGWIATFADPDDNYFQLVSPFPG